MEKGSEVTLLLAKLEPDTLNNFNSLIFQFLGKTFIFGADRGQTGLHFYLASFP